MKIILIAIIFFSLLSCNQANQNSKETKEFPPQGMNQNINSEVQVDSTESAGLGEVEPQIAEESNSEVMLNPPHGEPNHRCDIPVGAPLNSESETAKKESEVMLNPPHGEPNHRCDIPVGAPLNSPAGTTSHPARPTATDLANNPMAPTVENAKRLNLRRSSSSAAPATGEKPRINPPHGQPWHRCDIAVGSPLP
ncbi:hypothetical protein [Marinilabilia salmonicolor]|uniref:hypothetical protein n=1 Tax=Marinilabilia salmonicolor TaxID=989 RepID=UPI00029A01FD|nr:hypothetical protein [Marinilabilia salmonicolor]